MKLAYTIFINSKTALETYIYVGTLYTLAHCQNQVKSFRSRDRIQSIILSSAILYFKEKIIPRNILIISVSNEWKDLRSTIYKTCRAPFVHVLFLIFHKYLKTNYGYSEI